MAGSSTKVAFIGLGTIGSSIAKCLRKADFDLTVWNRTASKMTPLVEQGAKPATSAKEAASDADVVITCLMDDQSVLDSLHGDRELSPGCILAQSTSA